MLNEFTKTGCIPFTKHWRNFDFENRSQRCLLASSPSWSISTDHSIRCTRAAVIQIMGNAIWAVLRCTNDESFDGRSNSTWVEVLLFWLFKQSLYGISRFWISPNSVSHTGRAVQKGKSYSKYGNKSFLRDWSQIFRFFKGRGEIFTDPGKIAFIVS